MLQVTVPPLELYDESENRFRNTKETVLRLEHSLVSLSKWESVWRKPFLSAKGVTPDEFRDYIRCMSLTQNVDPNVYRYFPDSLIPAVHEYIDTPQTATTFSSRGNQPPSREIVTSEVIYFWMVANGIPFEAQKWHLSRLLTLIRVCNVKSDNKKMPKSAVMKQNSALNKARRARMGSRG